MEKKHLYKGYEITVQLECVRAVTREFTYGPASGYVAVVSVCTVDPRRPIGMPVRLVAEGNHVFGSEDDALTAGVRAAQHAIDTKAAP
ncbi:hypothetical protein E1N52_40420 [Paraburkholderia guartelaensis]|uniref:Uncharacterized protein n=1 Tax=Paraburkholderia guartelaensis TaxID=2546446 RepID=A0A4R5L1E8_9BURK|nr:hypothetical protein E1N52_40420 [Paraburkholderia guartelaensis]